MPRLGRLAASIVVGLSGCASPPPAEPARPVLVSPPWDWIHWDAPAATPVVAAVPSSTIAATATPWTPPRPPSTPPWTPRPLAPAPREPFISTGMSVSVSGGTVQHAGSQAMGWNASFQRCYAAAVKADPTFEGVVRLQVIIGPTGAVTDVQSAHAGPMDTSPALDTFLECIAAAPFAETFAIEDGDHAVLQLTLRLTQETVGPNAPVKGPTS